MRGVLYAEWGTLAFLEKRGESEGLSNRRVTDCAALRAREGPAWIHVYGPVPAAKLLFLYFRKNQPFSSLQIQKRLKVFKNPL